MRFWYFRQSFLLFHKIYYYFGKRPASYVHVQWTSMSSTEISIPLQGLNLSKILNLSFKRRELNYHLLTFVSTAYWTSRLLWSAIWVHNLQVIQKDVWYLDTGLYVSEEKHTCCHEIFHSLYINSTKGPTF